MGLFILANQAAIARDHAFCATGQSDAERRSPARVDVRLVYAPALGTAVDVVVTEHTSAGLRGVGPRPGRSRSNARRERELRLLWV